jgi:hypothetical protein
MRKRLATLRPSVRLVSAVMLAARFSVTAESFQQPASESLDLDTISRIRDEAISPSHIVACASGLDDRVRLAGRSIAASHTARRR